jgi:hypothetical protein
VKQAPIVVGADIAETIAALPAAALRGRTALRSSHHGFVGAVNALPMLLFETARLPSWARDRLRSSKTTAVYSSVPSFPDIRGTL